MVAAVAVAVVLAPAVARRHRRLARRRRISAWARAVCRVLLSYPNDVNDLLLSGELVGGENITGNAALVDAPFGKGHVVLFGVRPFWRYETSGNYFLVFNAMLNWDHLGAGR